MKWRGIFFTWERITSEHETKDRTFWGQTVSGRTEQFTSVRVDNTHHTNSLIVRNFQNHLQLYISRCPIAQAIPNVNYSSAVCVRFIIKRVSSALFSSFPLGVETN